MLFTTLLCRLSVISSGRTPRKYRCFFPAILGFFLISSCAPLPEYARPQFYNSPSTWTDDDNTGFGYRELVIEDFQAEELPPDFIQYQASINARSCLTIRPSSSTNARISEVSYYGNPLVVGNFTHISFEALFIPSCSWWNDTVSREKIDYVLQHEQVHFMIAELSARRATSELESRMVGYTAVGGTRTEVAEELNRVLQDSVHELLEIELEVHTDFDEDTSMFFDQDRQNFWYEKLARELKSGLAIR